MSWYKLESTNEQTTGMFSVEIMEAFQRAFFSSSQPLDMAMFSEFNHQRGAADYYFTPSTKKYSLEFLQSIGASPCDRPHGKLSLMVGHQDALPRYRKGDALDR